MNAVGMDGLPVGQCTRDPERWVSRADEDAKAICRLCPRRWACAREAVELPRAEGLWAGIVIPEAGRGRTFALRQLRSLAEQNGTATPSVLADCSSNPPETLRPRASLPVSRGRQRGPQKFVSPVGPRRADHRG
ncbi:hypothetical protein MARA_02800 (plasmid) [Mycolicibacterium arabiense]|uniref:4Fe-4S Wbl-type domain-containing protein n=1 Tax=Mycolicibacterium arabiense TaxID=1286181 RepID=A0A7I7RRL9_9MYCO|nr:hypothetical protein MARA_02800 [Mycolicibacterium arabiense]